MNDPLAVVSDTSHLGSGRFQTVPSELQQWAQRVRPGDDFILFVRNRETGVVDFYTSGLSMPVGEVKA